MAGTDYKASKNSSLFPRRLMCILTLAVLVLVFSVPAFAASSKSAVQKNKWVTNKGYYYYRGSDGKCVTGVQVIKKKCYLFDAKGRQLHGWRKVGKRYFFFKNKKGAKGDLAVSTTINGIDINSKGVAQLPTSLARKKAATMADYSEWTDKFLLPTMTNKEKLFACLNELKKFGYKSEGNGIIEKDGWDVICAADMIDRKNTGGSAKKANCYHFASAFAYMVNCIGYSDVQVCGYPGHGWARIGKNVFDITYSIRIGTQYFPVPAEQRYHYRPTHVRELDKL